MVKKAILIMVLLALGVLTVQAMAEPDNTSLIVGESKIVTLPGLTRVAVGNQDVIEVVVTSGQQIVINAKKPGFSMVTLWAGAEVRTLRISVQEDYTSIEREISRLINNPDVKVTVNAKYAVLDGKVATSLDADQAIQYAKMYRENIINNLDVKIKYQILLSIFVTEISRDASKKYGFQWGSYVESTNGEIFNAWNMGFKESGMGLAEPAWQKIGTTLNAMQKNGDAKILAAPTILTLSGKEAFFLAGGEIPIPLSDGQGGVKVEWKEYGIKLRVTANISREEMIVMTVSPEVSSLDWSNAITINSNQLPAISSRKASVTVQFLNGSTLAIGGLLKKEDSLNVYKLPILGDLPIIGSLFRSKEFENNKTELLIFVTPQILKSVNGNEVKPNPENIIVPPNQGSLEIPDGEKKK